MRPQSVFLLNRPTASQWCVTSKTEPPRPKFHSQLQKTAIPLRCISGNLRAIEPLAVNISTVDSRRLLDVYTVSLKAKNLSDEAWSYDSYCVYVYNASPMKILVNGILAHDEIIMGYDFEDGEVMRTINFLQNRAMFGMELIKTIKIDDKSYAWSSIADRVTWKVEGESVYIWNDGKRINDEYNPVLLPDPHCVNRRRLWEFCSDCHPYSYRNDQIHDSNSKAIERQALFFRVYPNVPLQFVIPMEGVKRKTVAFTGEVGVYEETGIKSSVTIYPSGDAENVYDYGYIYYTDLLTNQNRRKHL